MLDMYYRIFETKNFFFTASRNHTIHKLLNNLFEINIQENQNQELISNCILTQIVTELLLQCPSIQQYITTQRMHSAEELLRNTKLSIAEIALLIGFMNASSFGKVFHKQMGITPGMYRKQWQLDYEPLS